MFADTWMHVMYDQMKMYYSQGANYGGARGSSAPLNKAWAPLKKWFVKFWGVSKNIDNVLFWRAISVLCNVIIVDYYV